MIRPAVRVGLLLALVASLGPVRAARADPAEPAPRLSGIVVGQLNGQSERRAIFHRDDNPAGQVVQEGDTIGAWTVLSIAPHAVAMQFRDERLVVEPEPSRREIPPPPPPPPVTGNAMFGIVARPGVPPGGGVP